MANYLSKSFRVQSFGIPAPTLTERNLPDQRGRVHIVTGGYAGVGRALTGILYDRGATIYVAGRSKEKAMKAIAAIKEMYPNAKGRLEFLFLDLNDLSTIRASVEKYLSREKRLDVLVNNAGVMFPPAGSKTKQGHDLQFGTNCLGPFLFTKLLHPILKQTALTAPRDTVRVLWAASSGVQVLAPKGGIVEAKEGCPQLFSSQQVNYGQTKVANIFYAHKTQQLLGQDGIVSVSFNPGNLRTELQRHSAGLLMKLADSMLHPAIFGAYTELYSGWSPEITQSSLYIIPWGRQGAQYVRSDILSGLTSGLSDRFWAWSEKNTDQYA